MRNFHDFELLREVGQGTTSRVYEAHKPSSITGEKVALKIFPKALWNEEAFRNRRKAEFDELSKFQHTNIVPLKDFITFEDQAAFVMKFVDGESLETVQGRLPFVLPEISLAIVYLVLDALHAAHSRGILHRDLKPANILISKDGEVFVTDFGHARFLNAPSATLAGSIVGSPEFMSPEQAQGGTVKASSDLFSITSVLYFLVTGTKAFARETLIETLKSVTEAKFEAPQQRNPKISATFSRILQKGLARNPEDRYASANEFQNAIFTYFKTLGLVKNSPTEIADLVKSYFKNPSASVWHCFAIIKDKLIDLLETNIASQTMGDSWEIIAHLSLVAPESPDVERLTNLLINLTQANSTPTPPTPPPPPKRSLSPVNSPRSSTFVRYLWITLSSVSLIAFGALLSQLNFFGAESTPLATSANQAQAPVATPTPAPTPAPVAIPVQETETEIAKTAAPIPAVVKPQVKKPVVKPKKEIAKVDPKTGQIPVNLPREKLSPEKAFLQSIECDVPEDVLVTWNGHILGYGKQVFKEYTGTYVLKLEKDNQPPIIQNIQVTQKQPVVIKAR